MNRKQKILLLSIIICLLTQAGIGAAGYLSLDLGLTFLGNTVSSTEVLGSALHPIIYGSGVSIPFYFSPNLYFKPSLFFTATNYLYDGTRALPAVTEHREFLVLFSNLDLLVGLNLSLSSRLSVELSVGPALVLRWPFAPSDETANEAANVLRYFFSSLQFLYPAAEVALKWDIENNLGLIFSSKVKVPIFHLTDGQNASWLDQLMISGTVGIIYNFKS